MIVTFNWVRHFVTEQVMTDQLRPDRFGDTTILVFEVG